MLGDPADRCMQITMTMFSPCTVTTLFIVPASHITYDTLISEADIAFVDQKNLVYHSCAVYSNATQDNRSKNNRKKKKDLKKKKIKQHQYR